MKRCCPKSSCQSSIGGIVFLALFCAGGFFGIVRSKTPAAAQALVTTEVTVACIQYAPVFAQPTTNRDALTLLIREAAGRGAKIIVLPEAALHGYMSEDHRINWHVAGRPLNPQYTGRDPATVAETIPGLSSDHFCTLARELQVYVTIPLIEKSFIGEETRFFNTVCLMSPTGKIVAHYRKLNPYPPAEDSWATAGDRGLQTYDTEYGRVGLAICYDIHGILKDYDNEKIWTLLFSTAWDWGYHPADWFWHKMPEKASDHHLNILVANWSADKEQKWRGYGFSEVIRADGQVLACSHSLYGSTIVYARLPVATRN
jgi:predicted amidohydrolase